MELPQVEIWCDGAALDNGKFTARAASAAVLRFKSKTKEVHEYLGRMTNNQAEIIAACIGLETLRFPCHVKLVSDSKYVINTMSEGWNRGANIELWERLDKAAEPHNVEWIWRPRNSTPDMVRADSLANYWAQKGEQTQWAS